LAASRRLAGRHDDVDRKAHELDREVGQAIHVALCVAIVDREILAFDVTEVPQALSKICYARIRSATAAVAKPADPIGLGRHLRGREKWRGEHDRGDDATRGPSPHGITPHCAPLGSLASVTASSAIAAPPAR